ncbi:MAG TPA: tetratricopeptide repeat protein [Geminicoccaceae bacterium]|nr:tetratricopeptide repeat protein [Geminicoccaceae bacterium]
MPSASTLLVAGLAVGAHLGAAAPAPAEMVAPAGGDVGACAASTEPGPRHAADPGFALSPATGRHGRTERPIECAAATDATSRGRDQPGLTVSLSRLATLYWANGRHDAAELLLKRAVAIDEKIHGPDHPGLAASLGQLAALYQAAGRNREAEPLLRRALSIDAKAFGREHPESAGRLNNLAVLYWATGRHDAAEPLFARALAILTKSLPPGHPVLAAIRENYVNLLVQLARRRGEHQVADSGSRHRTDSGHATCRAERMADKEHLAILRRGSGAGTLGVRLPMSNPISMGPTCAGPRVASKSEP